MKKICTLFMTVLMLFALAGCNKDLSEAEILSILDSASQQITLVVETSADLSLIQTLVENTHELDVSWSSSHPLVIDTEGHVNRPTFEQGNVTVTMTASLTYLEVIKQFDFTVVVLALEEVVVPTYTVTFHVNGGSDLDVQEVAAESLLVLPEDPTKTGYVFEGWFIDIDLLFAFDEVEVISANLELYAKWAEILTPLWTVTFNAMGGTYVVPIENIEDASVIDQPSDPIKNGFVFMGWAEDIEDTSLWNFEFDAVESNVTLYAIWEVEEQEVPDGTPIMSVEEFYTFATSGTSDAYYLANDLDFTGYTWIYKTATFKGILDGDGKTISNLNINVMGIGGFFTTINNGTVKNLIIDNTHVNSVSGSQRAGLIAGQTGGGINTVENVTIINSSVTASRQEGAGLVFGQAKHETIFNHIIIMDSQVTNILDNAGSLIGQGDGTSITASNIYINNVTVRAQKSVDSRAGGLFGEMKGGGQIHVNNAVMVNMDIEGPDYTGGIIGRSYADNISSLDHIFFSGRIANTGASKTHSGTIAGGIAIANVSNIYMASLITQGTQGDSNLASEFIFETIEELDNDWWHTFLPNIADHLLWTYTSNIYELTGSYIPENSLTVRFIYGHHLSDALSYVKENAEVQTPTVSDITGFTFINWYIDASLQNTYDFDLPVTEDLILYAKWEAIPTHTVTLDGVIHIISENDFIPQPFDPVQPGKIFAGWFLGETLFDFGTPITEDITIISQWEDAQIFTITFNSMGGSAVDPVDFYENQMITELPKPILEDFRFKGWYLDEDLTLLFTFVYLESNMTLYASYTELGELIFEESFDYPAATPLSDTPWHESEAGQATIIEGQTLELTEGVSEAIYDQHLDSLAEGRYVLVFDFMQLVGGASFTIELTNGTQRIFTVGANRENRFTYRNADGSETALSSTIHSVTPGVYHQAIVVFDTEFDFYKYYVRYGEDLYEITPLGGVDFMSDFDITHIRIRIVGGTISSNPKSYLQQIFIESSSEIETGKSLYDPELPIDYEAILDGLYEALSIPFADDIRGDLFLTTLFGLIDIVWTSSNTDVISDFGVVTRDPLADIHVSMTASFGKLGIEKTKEIVVLVKSLEASVEFLESDYSLTGFALDHVSIPNLQEGDPGYYVVTTPLEFMNAINAENNVNNGTTAARVIEIRADLDMGYQEVTAVYGTLKNLDKHADPKIHPILIQSGVSMIRIQDRDGSTAKYHEGLMIFSETGNTIRHASFNIKRANNIIIRNLKFDELWEWDEATKGDYDSNDWDYFTVEQVNGIWFDHIELGKAYDGLIDFKAGSSTIQTVINATFSYMKLVFEPNAFLLAQFQHLEANRNQYSYYNAMRNAGMSMEEIMQVNSYQKKGFLLGGSALRVGNLFTLTIYNSYIKNLQDRFPRLRGGDVHLFNNIYDATDVYDTRNEVRSLYPTLFSQSIYNRQLTNQALVTTENGAIMMENSIIKGVTQVIKSNQVNTGHPQMTGKYLVYDSLFELGDYIYYGSSNEDYTPFVRANSEPILPFSWTTIEGLIYTNYRLIPVNILEDYLN
ncbi:MAG: InlB B-repeat-containing protein, partial [Acholeplasmataceae bacterium]|nr:InlB B-repeat-containing protein [Acholeplasmataceae bacterium]